MERNQYIPPLPIGFGWDSEEEDSNDEQSSFDFCPDASHYKQNVITTIKNSNDQSSINICNNIGNLDKMLQIEKLVEANRLADQQDLINFEQSGTVITLNEGRNNLYCTSKPLESDRKNHLLPLQSIAYDYTCLPLRIVEQERKFLPLIAELNAPFLRPIIVDGIGLIKAYWEGCSDDDEDGNKGATSYLHSGDRSFPIVPIIRCLFYWISRGHLTLLCFPLEFNPLVNHQEYGVSDKNLQSLKLLESYGLALFFKSSCNSVFPNQKWFTDKRDSLRACLVTSISHYIEGMPSNLHQDFNYKTWNQANTCSERTLQPYYGPRGDLVFFSPIKEGKREFVTDTVLDNDIKTEMEFEKFERFQLQFIDQAKYLKILYELLPKEKRAQEAHVMVALLNRLEWHLTH